MTWTGRMALLAALLLATGLVTVPALGATRHEDDPRDEYNAAAKDIRHARYTNGRAITAVVRMRHLGRRSTGWAQLNLRKSDYRHPKALTAVRRADGEQSIRRQGIPRCRGLVARYEIAKDRVRFVIPQRCLGRLARTRWRMDAYVGGLPLRGANAHDATAGRWVAYD